MILFKETLKNSAYKFRVTLTTAKIRNEENIDTVYPSHLHDSFIEIEYVYDGYMDQIINGKKYRLESGSVTVLRPSDYHNCKVSSDAKLFTLHLMPQVISRELLYNILNCEKEIVYTFDKSEAKYVFDNCMQLHKEYTDKKDYFENICKNLFENIIYTTLRKLDEKPDNEYVPMPLEKAVLYLRTSFMNNPSLEDTAKYVHLNASYFSRIFKNHTGYSFNGYLNKLKLEYAQKLLTETDMTGTDICFNAGFGSLSNFSRTFKSHFKISANEYKQKYRKSKMKFYDEGKINFQH